MYQIYKLTSPSGKVYIGYTKHTAEIRFNQHVQSWKRWIESGRKKKRVSTKLYYGFDSYDPNEWNVETLEVVDDYKETLLKEDYYINKFNSIENGYNLIPGGHGGKSKKLDEEHKEKIKEGLLKYWETSSRRSKKEKKEDFRKSEEWKRIMSERSKGNKHNVDRISINNGIIQRNIKKGEEIPEGFVKGKLKSNIRKGFAQSENQKKLVSEKKSKNWIVVFKDNSIKKFKNTSINKIAKELNVNLSRLCYIKSNKGNVNIKDTDIVINIYEDKL